MKKLSLSEIVTIKIRARPALLVGNIAAHGVTVLLLRRSILTEKVARRGFHVMREYSVDPLTMVRVGEVMDKSIAAIPANMPLTELADRIARHDPKVARHEGILMVDDKNELVGIITRGDVLGALEQNGSGDTTVLRAGTRELIVTYPDEVLYEAATKMLRNNIGRLPVVSRQNPRRIVGYLGRSNLMAGHRRQLEEEFVRERRFARSRPKTSIALAPSPLEKPGM